MKIAIHLIIMAMVFSSGRAINCFFCIEGVPIINSNSNSNAYSKFFNAEYMPKSPTEHCKIRGGVIVGPTCTATTTCAKVNLDIDKLEPITVRTCSAIEVSDEDLPNAHGKVESRGVTLTTFACNENLCNGASSLIKISTFKLILSLLTFFFI